MSYHSLGIPCVHTAIESHWCLLSLEDNSDYSDLPHGSDEESPNYSATGISIINVTAAFGAREEVPHHPSILEEIEAECHQDFDESERDEVKPLIFNRWKCQWVHFQGKLSDGFSKETTVEADPSQESNDLSDPMSKTERQKSTDGLDRELQQMKQHLRTSVKTRQDGLTHLKYFEKYLPSYIFDLDA